MKPIEVKCPMCGHVRDFSATISTWAKPTQMLKWQCANCKEWHLHLVRDILTGKADNVVVLPHYSDKETGPSPSEQADQILEKQDLDDAELEETIHQQLADILGPEALKTPGHN